MAGHDLALVLGGGGAAGHAWLIGVLAGLAEAGRDLARDADMVIGTSAGATAAVHVRSGGPLAEQYAAILDEQPPSGLRRSPPPAIPVEAVFARMRAAGAAATSALGLQQAMGAFALESNPLFGPEAGARRRAMVAARLPDTEWPERPTLITAVDATSGELVAFDSASGVDLTDAVTASTAAPGLVPTVRIAGCDYIDGGVRSVENADLAEGYSHVVVLSPFGGRTRTEPGQFEGLRREAGWRTTLDSQAEFLRANGSRVDVIVPDAASRAAMGANAMDYGARVPSARAGHAQGLAIAEGLAG